MMTTWSRLSRGPKWLVLCTYDAKVSINYLVKIHTRRRCFTSPADAGLIEVGLHNVIYRYMGAWVELYRMVKKAI